MKNEQYKGYDPYDALNSPLFKFPVLKSNKILRLVAQQILKRLFINFRPFLRIKKGLNPVTLGLAIQAYSYLLDVFPENESEYKNEIKFLLHELINLSSKGFSGYCWGYDFDWEAKYAKVNAYFPTVVATGIIINGLFELYKVFKKNNTYDLFNSSMISKIEEIILSSADFVCKDLNKSYDGDTFCYSYSPSDSQKVLNASMKGVRILSQAYTINNNLELIQESEKAVKYVVNNQNQNGSWIYSIGDSRDWADSYHTGYILDCFKDFYDISGKIEYKESLNKGFDYFCNNFIEDDGFPKYYDSKKYPADCTSAGQIILTLSKFGNYDLAEKVSTWMNKNMQSESGYFYYQKNKYYTNKISYMRWSNAWMFVALSYYLSKGKL